QTDHYTYSGPNEQDVKECFHINLQCAAASRNAVPVTALSRSACLDIDSSKPVVLSILADGVHLRYPTPSFLITFERRISIADCQFLFLSPGHLVAGCSLEGVQGQRVDALSCRAAAHAVAHVP
ncbi:MAG: hypothetical protein PVI91_17700, partial [Gammaproteobacteria bacterium]